MLSEEIDELITVDSLPIDSKYGATYIINQPNPNSYTHNYFKYPCKFIPEIPRWAIKKYLNDENSVVFDPFSGSGTTLLESVINNHKAYGTEIDDIAKLLIMVKTTQLSNDEIEELKLFSIQLEEQINTLNTELKIAHIQNINHWFPEENITQLGQLRTLIESIENVNTRNFLKVCFISIIKKCSYTDDMSPKPYVSTKIIKQPSNPINEFKNVFNRYISSMEEYSSLENIEKSQIVEGDALNINLEFQIDLAITSPPYINAFDYARTLRLENLWLGNLSEDELRNKKALYVGTEKLNINEEELNLQILENSNLLKECYHKIYSQDKKRALIVKKFFEDMKTNLIQIRNNLKPNGHYCIVIGNSNIRKIEIESWKIIRDIALSIGYVEIENYSYVIQNPYLRIPRSGRGGKINKDFVLVLKKQEN